VDPGFFVGRPDGVLRGGVAALYSLW
jgi:hypothetical protein